MLWHEEEWETGEEQRWQDRDRLHKIKLASLVSAAEELKQLKSRRAHSESIKPADRKESTGIISRTQTASVSWWNKVRNGSTVAVDPKLPEDEASALPNILVTSHTDNSISDSSTPQQPHSYGSEGVPIHADGASVEKRRVPVLISGTDVEAGMRLNSNSSARHTLPAQLSRTWLQRQNRSNSFGGTAAASEALHRSSGMAIGHGHGTLLRTNAVVRRPLPMVALEIEQRLGDLFMDYRVSRPDS